MKNSAQDKMEQARIAREREMEALMVARSHAIEEEEMERAAEEAERRSGKCIYQEVERQSGATAQGIRKICTN